MGQLVIELPERRRGPVESKTGKVYFCTFVAPRDTTTGIPARGDAHPVESGALAVNISSDVKGGAAYYTVEYLEEQIYGA